MRILSTSTEDLEICSRLLKDGDIVAIPTETVYGLAANALDSKAVEKIFKAKGRPADNPLIVHISDIAAFEDLCVPTKEAYMLAEKFWPGPLTMILPKKPIVPTIVTAGLDSVAIRMPSHPTAKKIISLCGVPLAAPSANISGKPSPTRAEHVISDMKNNPFVAAVVSGGACECGVESTVVSLTGEHPCLLRPGAVTVEQLREVLPDLTVAQAVLQSLPETEKALSPGLKHKHYAPDAETVCLCGSTESAVRYIENHKDGKKTVVICFDGEQSSFADCETIAYGSPEKPETLAENVFDALRKADVSGCEKIYVRCAPPNGTALAVYNRLLRASNFCVINTEELI
ncbi:MAG: threonylcarbamoyl-AMP synthase [Clostridia bacterium]|nr:threonylcarbamoyl-AMP synthase [Clostridia bacterium]